MANPPQRLTIRHWQLRHVLLVLLSLGVVSLTGMVTAQEQDFATWLEALRTDALQRGVRPQTLDLALADLQPLPRVLELDRRQLEFTLTFTQYLARVVPDERRQRGRQLMNDHRDLLTNVGANYGVQPRFIVALWGIESDFGQRTGGFPVIASLATLAHDGRRSALFRRELLDALQILDEGHVPLHGMTGSWAGAMGQNQFMPSSFRHYAIDYNRDGRRDIWTTLDDIFASTANYLARAGWRGDQTWGRRVTLPPGFDVRLATLEASKPLSAWQALGIQRVDGGDLPQRPLQASLVLPDGPDGPAFLVYANFRTLLKWNRSTYFALAVGYLADSLQAP